MACGDQRVDGLGDEHHGAWFGDVRMDDTGSIQLASLATLFQAGSRMTKQGRHEPSWGSQSQSPPAPTSISARAESGSRNRSRCGGVALVQPPPGQIKEMLLREQLKFAQLAEANGGT